MRDEMRDSKQGRGLAMRTRAALTTSCTSSPAARRSTFLISAWASFSCLPDSACHVWTSAHAEVGPKEAAGASHCIPSSQQVTLKPPLAPFPLWSGPGLTCTSTPAAPLLTCTSTSRTSCAVSSAVLARAARSVPRILAAAQAGSSARAPSGSCRSQRRATHRRALRHGVL